MRLKWKLKGDQAIHGIKEGQLEWIEVYINGQVHRIEYKESARSHMKYLRG